jgi:thiol-disulfide isomerase/thioredoxin
MTRSGRALNLPGDSPLRRAAAQSPALVIFLRSFGCTFCREAMDDVSRLQKEIRAAGAGIVFVHGATAEEAAPWFSKYGLDNVTVISDPDLAHYRAFGLGRTRVTDMVAPKVWKRGAQSALAHGFGTQTIEMMRQLPGVFVVQAGEVLAEYRHQSPADRPDYLSLIRSTM